MRRWIAVLALAAASCARGEPEAARSFVWQPDREWLGGLSAIHVYPGGDRALVLGDNGFLIEMRLGRTPEGEIVAADWHFVLTLPADDGTEPTQDDRIDSEGLAVSSAGDLFVSFEGDARVRREALAGGTPEVLPRPREFAGLQDNAALEALAIGQDGALYAIPERSGRFDRPFPVFRFRDGLWDVPFTIPRRGPFVVTGADVGPDGRLYVLERDFTGIGFRSRVRRFDLGGGVEETLLETGVGVHDNLEGISVWRQDDGRLRMTMISDDNYRWLQRTEIVEYVLDE